MNTALALPLLMLAMLVLAVPAGAEEPAARTISVNGTATVHVTPDEADLRLSVRTFQAELPRAKEENDEAAEEVLRYLRSVGIDSKDVQASIVSSQAIYEYRNDNGRQIRGPITGYEVSRQYAVKLRDLTKLGPIYDQLLPNARVTLEGHTLGTSQSRKYRDQARTDAAKAAREKANLLAGAFGATVGAPRVVSEVPPQVFYPHSRFLQNVAMAAEAGGGGGGENLTPVGQIEVRAEVNATFDLVPEGKGTP